MSPQPMELFEPRLLEPAGSWTPMGPQNDPKAHEHHALPRPHGVRRGLNRNRGPEAAVLARCTFFVKSGGSVLTVRPRRSGSRTPPARLAHRPQPTSRKHTQASETRLSSADSPIPRGKVLRAIRLLRILRLLRVMKFVDLSTKFKDILLAVVAETRLACKRMSCLCAWQGEPHVAASVAT